MQLQSPRPEHGAVGGDAGIADGRLHERKRRTLHARRQATHAGLGQSPTDDAGGRASRLGDFERSGKLADQKLWVIDLDGGHSERKLELQRRRALELETGAAATHFDAKRITADRLGGAVLRPAGLPFALAPYGDLRLRARGGIEPHCGPRPLPAAPPARTEETAASGGAERPRGTRTETSWRSCACQASWRLPRRALSKAAIAALQSQFTPAVPALRATPRSLISHPMDPNPAHATEDLWVFAYGSLMWRPDFSFAERVEARLVGAHRALCVYSFVHRGTPERPGLVLGLDRGGTCRGIAYRVTAANRSDTIAYLRAREQVTSVYLECVRPIWLKLEPDRRVPALCYIVDRGHAQYAGRLSLEQQLHHVRQGHGQSGANRDYVIATVGALEQLGYRETALHLIAQRLAGIHEAGAAAKSSS